MTTVTMMQTYRTIIYCCLFLLSASRLALGGVDDVSVTYARKLTYTLHEPVVLPVKFSNLSVNQLTLKLGKNEFEGIEIRVRKPDGSMETITPPRKEGFGSTGEFIIESGQALSQSFVLNAWYGFPQQGLYIVTFRLTNPATSSADSDIAIPVSEPIEIMIDARNEEKLTRLCHDLAEASSNPNLSEARLPAIELSYVADDVAIPFLEGLIFESGPYPVNSQLALNALGRIGDRQATTVIERAANSGMGMTSTLAGQVLEKLSRSSHK